VGSDGRFLPLAGLEFRSDPAAEATTRWPSLTFADTRDYVMWVLGAPAAAYGTAASELAQMDGGSLTDLAANLIADWHADIGEVVRRADPATVASTRLRTAEPLQQWETGPVTLVGDAIHCMVPAGIGAAVALRDAALLARRLAEAAQGMRQLVDATCAYETEMLEYGFAAVQAALQVQRQMAP
jgi:2-polyprenyl-6-methoxyphenol hydroxylase-like FAD-dependent oxidoreductase